MGKGKGGGSKLSITSYAISDTFLPFRIALVSLILFLGVAAFLFSGGLVPFLSLAPAALLEKMDRIRVYEYEIVHEFPHDPTAFTQGLVYNGNETFYESTGLYRKSSVRKVDVTTGKVGSFDHPMRGGWGLTTDGEHIIGSDGSANLYFMDPSTFKEVRKIVVQDEGRPVRWLNELEYISNEIWSNVFQTECIARISPKDGKVTGWLLMHGLQ